MPLRSLVFLFHAKINCVPVSSNSQTEVKVKFLTLYSSLQKLLTPRKLASLENYLAFH